MQSNQFCWTFSHNDIRPTFITNCHPPKLLLHCPSLCSLLLTLALPSCFLQPKFIMLGECIDVPFCWNLCTSAEAKVNYTPSLPSLPLPQWTASGLHACLPPLKGTCRIILCLACFATKTKTQGAGTLTSLALLSYQSHPQRLIIKHYWCHCCFLNKPPMLFVCSSVPKESLLSHACCAIAKPKCKRVGTLTSLPAKINHPIPTPWHLIQNPYYS